MKHTTYRKSLFGALACAALTLSGLTGYAQDAKDIAPTYAPTVAPSSFYMSAFGGANFLTGYGNRQTNITAGGASANVTPGGVHSELGSDGGLRVGYKFGPYPVASGLALEPAVEAEAMYLGQSNTAPLGGGFGINQNMSLNNAAWFVNTVVRFKLDCPLTPYVGIGIGGEYLTANINLTSPAGSVQGSADDVDFAVTGKAGVEYKVMSHWSIFTEYQFIDAIDTKLNLSGAAGTYSFSPNQIGSHLVNAGVKYDF